MFEEIRIWRLSVGSIYKLFGIGLLFSLVPFSVLMGVFALFGANTVVWNGRAITGTSGLGAAFFVGLSSAVTFTVLLGTLSAFGLWLFSKFQPLTLLVKSVISSAGGQT